MKKTFLLIGLFLIATLSFSDSYITRGPAIGEIYFIGPTNTGLGIYFSTNFGESAICMDSIIAGDAISITADKTAGIIYYVTSLESLYVSYDYGQQGTWNLQNSEVAYGLSSGRNEGEILASFYMQSDDFGENFYYHNCNGFYGGNKGAAIDNMNGVGYALAYDPDTSSIINVFYTYDNFENMRIVNSFNFMSGHVIFASRGSNYGELYVFNRNRIELYYSNNFAESFNLNEFYNFDNYYHLNIVGGHVDGEIYMMYVNINMMWQNAHTYIFHSTDYGVTFNVYHPFSKGQEPLLANFSGIPDTNDPNSINQIPKYGGVPLDVQFHNYSIGNINTYEWDFENDGIIDSHEENPLFTYVDTGFHSVRLTVYDNYDTNSFLKENYIYVDFTTHTEDINTEEFLSVINYPNPVNHYTVFEIKNLENSTQGKFVEIFDLEGNQVNSIPIEDKLIWNRMDYNSRHVPNGIYLYRLSTQTSKANKMILM
ncbi:MAG: T9SS type A sorting domain-containing protein [bacterium]